MLVYEADGEHGIVEVLAIQYVGHEVEFLGRLPISMFRAASRDRHVVVMDVNPSITLNWACLDEGDWLMVYQSGQLAKASDADFRRTFREKDEAA